MPRPDQLAQSALRNQGQGNFSSEGNQSNRIVYPAAVINNNDPLGMNRIQARIVNTDENSSSGRQEERKQLGNTKTGKDKDKLDENLVWCIPWVAEHLHLRPQAEKRDEEGNILAEGEMVFLILENPSDSSSPRYWTGPIRTSQLKLKYQSFSDAKSIYTITRASTDNVPSQNPALADILPGESDVALQGKDDADLILKQQEALLIAGKFNKGTLQRNTLHPSSIQLKQFTIQKEDEEIKYSQANLTSTNINIFSPDGKFRGPNAEAAEKNPSLEDWGELANSLHPAVFGDELVNLLDLMIRIMLNHIHTPQESLVPTDDSGVLSEFTVDGRLQELISYTLRIN